MRTLPKLALLFALILCSVTVASAQSNDDEQSARYAAAGQHALSSGQYVEARNNFEALAKLHPSVAEVHATLAVIHFKLRDYESAIREIRTAQKLKPGLPKLESLLALSLSEIGEFKEALPHLEKGFKQTADPEVRRMCGLQLLRAYTNLGRDSDAVETSLALNKLYPDDPEVLYHTGRIYGNRAYVVMETLHDKAPDSVWMLQAQGEANESQKDYDAAIVAYNHVLTVDPHRPNMHYRLGRVYLDRFQSTQKSDDRDAARHEFQSELEVDPSNGNALYELAQMAADDNQLDDARKGFEALVQHFPDFEQALVGLGGVLIQNQTASQAVAPLEHAVKLDPDDEVAWYRLAQAQRAAGNREAAQTAMDTFRKVHAAALASRAPRPADEVTPQHLDANAPSTPQP